VWSPHRILTPVSLLCLQSLMHCPISQLLSFHNDAAVGWGRYHSGSVSKLAERNESHRQECLCHRQKKENQQEEMRNRNAGFPSLDACVSRYILEPWRMSPAQRVSRTRFSATDYSFIERRRDASSFQDLFEVTGSMRHFALRQHLVLGKHFVFGFCAVFLLTFGPVRVASAQYWWPHTGPGPKGAGADQKVESTSKHSGKAQLEKPTPLYTSPKTVGWWYKTPAPMGAGADTRFSFYSKWTRPHLRRAQHEKLTPLYTSPKSVGWWYKTPGPIGAGADTRFYFYSKWAWPHM
jgi:hypothetical protein